MVGEPTAPKLKVFNCPNCGAGVVLRAQGKSLSVTCGSCGSIIDATNENFQILSKYEINAHIKPLIPLGTRASLKGDTWEAIGFVIRKTGGIYQWREYLLYNPFKGFRWLTEYDGHWTFVTMTKERPKRTFGSLGAYVTHLGKSFKLFQSGQATVDYVLGEFYWRVKVGEAVDYSDYIAPPHVLSAEGTKEEIVWSLGEYIEPMEISSAFKLGEAMPARLGIGSCQPFPHQEVLTHLWVAGMMFVFLLFLIHLLSSNRIFENFIFCALLVLLPPIAFQFYRSSFEQRRWGDGSDISQVISFFGGGDD